MRKLFISLILMLFAVTVDAATPTTDQSFAEKILHSSTNFNTTRQSQFSGPWIPMGQSIGVLSHNAT